MKRIITAQSNIEFLPLLKPLYENLDAWWVEASEKLGAEFLKLSKNPAIPKELKTCQASKLYRGLQIKERSLSKILDGGKFNLNTASVSSWSEEKHVAMQFGQTDDYTQASVVMRKEHFANAIVFNINNLYNYLMEQLKLLSSPEDFRKSSFTKQERDRILKKTSDYFTYQHEILLDNEKAQINFLDLLEITAYKYANESWQERR